MKQGTVGKAIEVMLRISGILRDLNIQGPNLESFNINRHSLFTHIGSYLGKPEFHVAFEIECKSVGMCYSPKILKTAELFKE